MKVSKGWFLLKVVRENILQASLLAPSGMLAIFNISWLVDTSAWVLFSSSHGIFLIYVCKQISPFYKDTTYIMKNIYFYKYHIFSKVWCQINMQKN